MCSKCKFETDDAVAQRNHNNFVHTEIFYCDMCPFSTTIYLFLTIHLSRHIRKNNQISHLRNQNRPKQIHKCELCNFQTVKLRYLKYHINSHM